MGLPDGEKCENMLTYFDTLQERDDETPGHGTMHSAACHKLIK